MAQGDDGSLVMEEVRLIFRNFAGKEGDYNREGDRNFGVLLDEDVAKAMLADNWNIKHLRAREEGDQPQAWLPVSIKFPRPGTKIRPVRMVMVTSRGRTNVDEEACELFDWVDIAKVDLIVRPYSWSVSGKSGVKAYLKSIFVTIHEDALELKYRDVPEIGAAPQLALEGAGQEYDFEGEVIEELPARAGRVDDPPWN